MSARAIMRKDGYSILSVAYCGAATDIRCDDPRLRRVCAELRSAGTV